MHKNIITISRQFACGGKEIGKMVANNLGIKFYDKEIIAIVAKESGYSVEFVEKADELVSSSLLYNVAMNGIYGNQFLPNQDMPISDKVYIAQYNIIRELAKKEPCVIIGRGSNYILRDFDDTLNVFLHADMDFRKKRATDIYKMSAKNLEKEIIKNDKKRAAHYNHYTDGNWGDMQKYDLALNSANLGIEKCVKIICDAVK